MDVLCKGTLSAGLKGKIHFKGHMPVEWVFLIYTQIGGSQLDKWNSSGLIVKPLASVGWESRSEQKVFDCTTEVMRVQRWIRSESVFVFVLGEPPRIVDFLLVLFESKTQNSTLEQRHA